MIPLEKLEKRYFFESDMLFRLNLSRVVVFDVPIPAIYGEEKSNLSPLKSVYEFSIKHTRNLAKRIFYNYFLRDFSIASVNLFFGVLLLLFGVISGWINWLNSVSSGIPTRESALILVTISIVVGLQLFLNALSYDIQQEPKNPLT
jgi:hypothetical protein